MSAPSRLSARLRLLRTSHFGSPVTQKLLSAALGVSAPTISSWETGAAVPPDDRLDAIATFFAVPRSREEGRVLSNAELTPEEGVERDKLLADLLALRPDDLSDPAAAQKAESADFWRFADDGPVRIICGQLHETIPEADPANRNYMALASYADLDSLVELFGHLRARNPMSDVRFARPDLLRDDDLHAHLVFLGNMAMVQSVENWLPPLPVRQIVVDDIGDGEIFEITDGGGVKQIRPTLATDGTVTEDVGFLARMPSATNPDRTLTICSGVFTRGVYAAVRCLTDQRVARSNHAYLRSRFAGAESFGVVMRVLVVRRMVPTPHLDDPRARLFEFA